jgi:ribosome-associated toxin RatA of RatAB toxin-antitoxin module
VNIHFNHTEPVEAPAEVLFDVITDYTNYPSFNSALIKVKVVTKDDKGAEFLAGRKTKIASAQTLLGGSSIMRATRALTRR